jgi:hypothetical protein
MDRSSNQRSTKVVGDASSLEGAKASSAVGETTAAQDMMRLETNSSGVTKSTSLAKRKC